MLGKHLFACPALVGPLGVLFVAMPGSHDRLPVEFGLPLPEPDAQPVGELTGCAEIEQAADDNKASRPIRFATRCPRSAPDLKARQRRMNLRTWSKF